MRPRRGNVPLAALLASVTLSGCGGSDPATSPTVTRTVTVTAASETVASTTATAKPEDQTCVNLPITPDVRAELLDGELDRGSVYYGRCGDTYWAVGSYTGPIGTEFYSFRRDRGQRTWKRVSGGTGGDHLCVVPLELVLIWGLRHICRDSP